MMRIIKNDGFQFIGVLIFFKYSSNNKVILFITIIVFNNNRDHLLQIINYILY
ncbi:hypothetical protein GLOIN_2v1690303 [Rhizophagus irregularis DAOM 181602=DAOM 197198]|uniref:Uncharacterized protein n=1 Tax=Rhizophagus irregularis (strain DAOM 181602 / DAOM 197198 / MUCL 43194) TaxID=747089 RepID=A0A2P4PCD2_RHIID|nr:hypothetical protein GLOIN_2v1690303 [Rhizophagus irregularis DAOM 181602=DAOM 197198]POG63042.1 hypothetical protein GLOIN_2v1690303 [Rhizophagus irregularis DAOM 181602=DAOM 197198]|eukprot:XP_025169908.1 hypothetical protein GLOIN_2v1690303 [Rhizophagus irregularis DAOM 181602=DAOM 197198]